MGASLFCDDDFNFGRAGVTGFEPSDDDVALVNDPRTGRPWGDHGTANQAIDFTLQPFVDLGCPAEDFLRCWRDGDLEEWPEFYDFLKEVE
jgi:hypothetical protein